MISEALICLHVEILVELLDKLVFSISFKL